MGNLTPHGETEHTHHPRGCLQAPFLVNPPPGSPEASTGLTVFIIDEFACSRTSCKRSRAAWPFCARSHSVQCIEVHPDDDDPVCAYLNSYQWASRLFPVRGCHGPSCCKRSCTSVLVFLPGWSGWVTEQRRVTPMTVAVPAKFRL